jgi:predicted PurR-regulated permease PerM
MTEAPGPNELRNPLVRQELQRALVWVSVVVAVALLWLLAQPLLLILGAIVFAAMLDGGTRLLGRVLPIGRGWRLALILLATVAFLGWVAVYAGQQLTVQAIALQDTIVLQIERGIAMAQANGMAVPDADPAKIVEYALGSVGRVTAAVTSVIGALTSLFLIFVLGIFIAMEPRLYERGFAWLLPVRERDHFYEVAGAMGHTLRRLMAGRLLGMLIEGIATWILLAVYGIPMALLLGIITGLLVFIPNVGAIISGVLMVLVGFSIGIDGGLYALAVYVVVQTVDGNIIVPMVAKRTVDLAPALVLGAQLLFGALFGLLGLALADPIIAMIKVFLEKNAKRGAVEAQAVEAVTATISGSANAAAAARIARRAAPPGESAS